jgi:hypothetical protein
MKVTAYCMYGRLTWYLCMAINNWLASKTGRCLLTDIFLSDVSHNGVNDAMIMAAMTSLCTYGRRRIRMAHVWYMYVPDSVTIIIAVLHGRVTNGV